MGANSSSQKKASRKPARSGSAKKQTEKKVVKQPTERKQSMKEKLLRKSTKEGKGARDFKDGLILKSEMDLNVKPGDDFWRYANGGWLDNNPVPEEFSRYGSFEVLNELTLKNLHAIANTAKDQNDEDSQKVAAFWESGMNTERIEELKLEPIADLLQLVDGITDEKSIAQAAARLHELHFQVFFDLNVVENLKNSSQMILWVDQGGLGMPDRDFYFDDEKKETREKYSAYVAKLFTLAGSTDEEAQALAAKVVELETVLAQASLRMTERRDPTKMHHPESMEAMVKNMEPFDFETFTKSLGVFEKLTEENAGPINNTVPQFLADGIKKALTDLSLAHIKAYFRFHVLNGAAPYLHAEMEDANFSFFGTTLSGQAKQKPRWKRVLAVLGRDFGRGEVLGKLYCAKHFPEESKTIMLEYIAEVRDALKDEIKSLKWMSEDTKTAALRKLAAFGYMIGFTEKWNDVSSLDVDASAYFANVAAARALETKNSFEEINGIPDKTKWEMPPQMINAYFHPSKNVICFPAAILQAPFFAKDFDPALCFGAICSVIGHEMVHSFDDQGRRFDHEGNVQDWWTTEDGEMFGERAKVIVEQFNNYDVHGLKVQGSLTQGENIADLGGMKVAFNAMQNYFKKNGRQPDLDGFTPEQRFFISWARAWRNNITEDRAKTLVTIDPHAPGKYRVLGPLCNLEEFYKAFDVKEGDKMFVPVDQRVDIW